MEALRDQWLAAGDLAERRKIAAAIQAQAFIDVPCYPLGQFFQPAVPSKQLVDGLTGITVFRNIRRV